jgi:hypothetical protein
LGHHAAQRVLDHPYLARAPTVRVRLGHIRKGATQAVVG